MAKVLMLTDRIKLKVEEKALVKCETCGGKGAVDKPKKGMRCPVCQGFKLLPGQGVASTVVYTLSPLSWAQKQEILSQSRMVSGQVVTDEARQTFLSIKYAVKGVDGLMWFNGTENEAFVPKFDPSGNLEEESVEALLNASVTTALTQFSMSLLGGITPFVIDKNTGLQMAGVSVELPGDHLKKD